MGIKNYLIDGVSCAGKTTICGELQRRGYQGPKLCVTQRGPQGGDLANPGGAADLGEHDTHCG
jgi:predicted ATPase